MPTYEYRCGACGHEFEAFQSMKDSALRKCPACAKNKLERLIGTGAAIVFKGSGFYQTDYRSESYKKSAQAEKGEKPKGEGKSEAKSEGGGEKSSTPEAKSTSTSSSTPGSKSGVKSTSGSGGVAKPGRKADRNGGGS